MITEMLHKISNLTMKREQVTEDIYLLQFTIVNACIVGNSNNWVLVDTGMANCADFITQAGEEFFGKASSPKAIILTHGHFDHIGCVITLSDHWKVPVYAHKLELPYLTGKKDYPQADPSVGGGMVAALSPAFPHHAMDLGEKVHLLPDNGTVPGMPGWKWIHTPGHTPGHICLFRSEDGILIAGDAFTTTKQESMLSVLTQKEEISGPPAYLTTDWKEAEKSVQHIKELNPKLALVSHGEPMAGYELEKHLELLVNNFEEIAVPEQGRFVHKK